METFSTNLRNKITALGLTHAEVARRCDLEVRRFHHYVIGDREPDLQTLVRISAVLGTTPDTLLGVAEGTTGPPPDDCQRLRSRLAAASLALDQRSLQFVMIVVDAVILEQRAASGQERGKGKNSAATSVTKDLKRQ
jgi:transcriptional regulator with XRE-family HTH domain